MLMDLFFGSAATERKARVHIHEFIASVHAFNHYWGHQLRQGLVEGEDPFAAAAQSIAGGTWLLCFDELSVNDIADGDDTWQTF